MSDHALLNRKLRRDLGNRRGQVIAVAVTVLVGIAVLILTSAVSSNLSRSKELTYERTSFADVWITGGSSDMAEVVQRLDGVETVEERTVADVGVEFADRPIRTRIVGFDSGTTLNRLVITSGKDLDPDTRGVVIEQHTAEHFDLGAGDLVSVAGAGALEVTGVAVSPEWLALIPSTQDMVVDPDEFGVVFVPETIAALAAPDSRQLVIAVTDRNIEAVNAVTEAALDNGAGEVVTWDTHPSNQWLQGDVDGFGSLAVMFPLLFLSAAGLATAVLLGRLVTQQRAEIGTLRANGFSTGALQRHFAKYGVVVALIGAIPAVPLGILSAWVVTTVYAEFLGIPFTSRQLYPTTWVLGLVFAVIVGAIAGAVPARSVARNDPRPRCDPVGGTVVGKRSVFERVLPGRSPGWIRMAFRNLSRQRGRAIATGTGVVLALVVIMTALVVNDTNSDMFQNQFTKEDQRGLVVGLDRPVDDVLVAQLADVDGVGAVEPHLEIGASFVADGVSVTEELQVYAAGTELHNFDSVGGLSTEGLVLSAVAADDLRIGVGDRVEVRALNGAVLTVEVGSIIKEPYSGSSYLSAQAWAALGAPPLHTLALGLENRDDHSTVRDSVATIDGVEQLTDHVAIAERLEGMMAASRTFTAVLLVLAVVMAVALIYNALSIAIGERETEVATLQANGVGRSWIRRTITAENLVTVGLALIPGLVFGRLIAHLFYAQFTTDQMTFESVLQPSSWLATVVIIAACGILAQFPGLRRLDHLDLPAKVRERAL